MKGSVVKVVVCSTLDRIAGEEEFLRPRTGRVLLGADRLWSLLVDD